MKKLLAIIGAMFVCAASATTINLDWVVDGNSYAQTTCESGADLIIPATPTKRGYHFIGWIPDYILLEYIESTGTQAINTGVKYTGNHFEVEWEAKDNSGSDSTLFAATKVPPYSGGLYGSKTNRYYYIGTGSLTVNYSSYDDAYHKWKMVVSNQTATLYKDGTQVGTANITGTIDTTHNIYLFCGGWTDASIPTLVQFASLGLKYWKLTDNGVVVFNGIPAKRVRDGEVGMYDTVTKTFFTNAGTGEFIAGPVSQNQILE